MELIIIVLMDSGTSVFLDFYLLLNLVMKIIVVVVVVLVAVLILKMSRRSSHHAAGSCVAGQEPLRAILTLRGAVSVDGWR